MALFLFVIIGAIVGWFVGGKDLLVGIAGSLLGGYSFDLFGLPTPALWLGALMSTLGSLFLLLIEGYISDAPQLSNSQLEGKNNYGRK